MKRITTISLVLSKLLELLHWGGVLLMAGVFFCSLAAGEWLSGLLAQLTSEQGAELATYGLEVAVIDRTGEINLLAVTLFSLGAVFLLSLMAMVFRNTYLILRRSRNTTPFQKDNLRMVKEIGIFSISVPIVSLLVAGLIQLTAGFAGVETSVRFDGLTLGILIFSLMNVFSHGISLQRDVDGLL